MSITASPIPLFAGLSKDAISSILAASIRRKYAVDRLIIAADHPAQNLLLVHSGVVDYTVQCRGEREILIRRFVPGDAFGVASLLSEPLGYLGSARAVRDSVLSVWDRATARHLTELHPRLVENALQIALRDLASYARRHLRLVCDSAEDRLATVLTRLGARAGKRLPSGVDVDIKNEELASLADVSPFTASRILRAWERRGAIRKKRGHVIIQAQEKLFQ